jgi:hypothetical protein
MPPWFTEPSGPARIAEKLEFTLDKLGEKKGRYIW